MLRRKSTTSCRSWFWHSRWSLESLVGHLSRNPLQHLDFLLGGFRPSNRTKSQRNWSIGHNMSKACTQQRELQVGEAVITTGGRCDKKLCQKAPCNAPMGPEAVLGIAGGFKTEWHTSLHLQYMQRIADCTPRSSSSSSSHAFVLQGQTTEDVREYSVNYMITHPIGA